MTEMGIATMHELMRFGMKNRIAQLIVFFAFINTCCFGQVHVGKVIRSDNRAYLEVWYVKGLDTIGFSIHTGIKNNYLRTSDKLQLIKDLLAFEGDTTRHSGSVYPVYFGNNERNNLRISPKSTYSTIEINAMYHINRIVYRTDADYYSPARFFLILTRR